MLWYTGPVIGSLLYDIGGFPTPFFSAGAIALLIAIMLLFSIPDVQSEKCKTMDVNSKVLTMSGIAKVSLFESIL